MTRSDGQVAPRLPELWRSAAPPQPPTPDYTESDILRAYREQKDLDFEDPYEDADSRLEPDSSSGPGTQEGPGDASTTLKAPAHQGGGSRHCRAKVLLGSPGEEVRG